MATFLELCQKVSAKSQIVSGIRPATVAPAQNTPGLISDIIQNTADAWVAIQNDNPSWKFMRKEFGGASVVTTPGTTRYTGAGSWGIADFSRWIIDSNIYTLYDEAIGLADEGLIELVEYSAWRGTYERGVQIPNRPTKATVSPSEEFCLGAVPDGAYRIRGEYYRTPQVLALDNDIPIMPVQFHDIIVHQSLIYLAQTQEATLPMSTSQKNYDAIHTDLVRDQAPIVFVQPEPLA